MTTAIATTEIINSYTSTFDGITIDTIKMTYPDGTVEIRYGWTEENKDGETLHFIRTSEGKVLNGKWATTNNNKWMTAYKTLRTSKPQAIVQAPETRKVIPFIRSYAGKAFSSGRIKSNHDLDITQEQMDKILSEARASLGI